MPTTRSTSEMLDRNFLETRHRLLDIAAALDRIERADDAVKTASDLRYLQLNQAIRVLIDGKPDRTERVQKVFSLPYNAQWQTDLGIGSK